MSKCLDMVMQIKINFLIGISNKSGSSFIIGQIFKIIKFRKKI